MLVMESTDFALFALVLLRLSTRATSQDCSLPDGGVINNNLLSLLISVGGAGSTLSTTLLDHHFTCLAVGSSRDRYTQVSVVVKYTENSTSGQFTAQFPLRCISGNLASEGELDQSPPANVFNISTRRDCFVCGTISSHPSFTIDAVADCVLCDSSCLMTGQGGCVTSSTDCCPFYSTDGSCTTSCATNYVATSSSGYTCVCSDGYTGMNCETSIENCASNPCVNGTCTDLVNGYSCTCQAGYTGTNCSIDIDDCVSNPCVNGTCTNLVNGYRCTCQAGFTGTNCSIDIDDCASNPCVNGSCTDLVNGYSCTCQPGYTGTNCDMLVPSVLENQLSGVILSVHNNNVTLNEKDTLLLSCSSYGYPEPIVYWRRNNQAVVISVRVKLSFVASPFDNQQNYVNSTLRILKLLPSDEGNYVCIASNVKGTRMSSTNITVKRIDDCAGSPCGSNGKCNDGIDTFMCNCSHGYYGVPCTKIPTPPKPKGVWIVSHPMNIQAELDQLVNLTCEVSGDPPITYRWTRDGVVLPGELLPYFLVQEVKPKHRGAYICKATNEVNSTTSQPGLLTINGIFQYEVQAFLNGSLDLLRGALLGPLVYYTQTANKTDFYNAHILSVVAIYSGSTEEGMSNRKVSVLVTVLDNDDRINSDNFEDRLKTSLMKHPSAKHFQLLNATVYDACPSQNIPLVSGSSIMIKWNESMILQQVKQPCPCQTLTQVFITRHCEGSYSQGAQWMDMDTTQCNLTERSRQLCEALSSSNKPAETVAEILMNLTAAPATLIPSEVTVAAVVIERLTLAAAENKSVRVNYLNSIDNIIEVDQEVIKQANASTSILQSLEAFSENVDVNFTNGDQPTFTRENFAIQLKQIDINNFAGESFNVDLGTVEEAMNKSGNIDPRALASLLNPLSNATGSLAVSNRVAEGIDSNASNSGRLGYSVFVTSSLFPTESVDTTVASVVLNLKLSGYTKSNDTIDDLFNVTFLTIDPPMNQDVDNETCANWNIRGGFGQWTSDACIVVSKHGERPVKCKCNQPAHFGLLFDLVPSAPLIPEALTAVTYIFLSLSIICLLILIITYLADKQLRTQPHDQIIINLSVSLFGLYAFFLISGHVTSVPALCGVSAGLLHYFMLVFFSWTAVESVFLFMKLVKVMGRGINRYTLKAGLLAWIVPAVLVVIVGGAGHMYYTNPFYCRADNIPFYVGTIVPIVLIFIFNWILYITIMVSVCHRLHSAAQVTNTNLSLRKLARTATVLSVVLGLGWAFGLVQTSAPDASSDAARVALTVFQVLFSLLVGLQGILMFGFYGIGNIKVREVWLKCLFKGKSKKVLLDLFSSSQPGSSNLKTDVLEKKTSASVVNECSEVPEKSVADILHDQPTTAVTHDEKIPMTDCAAYTIVNPSSEKPMVLKETTAEADNDNPDVLEKTENFKEECCAIDYKTPVAITDTKTQIKNQDTAV